MPIKFVRTGKVSDIFITVFLFWFVGGLLSLLLRSTAFSERIAGFAVDYGDYIYVASDYMVFIVSFVVIASMIPSRRTKSVLSAARYAFMFKLALGLVIFSAVYKSASTGAQIFSGDYFARFESNNNLLAHVLPNAFTIVAVQLLSTIESMDERSRLRYITIILASSAIAALGGSRAVPFYGVLSILILLYRGGIAQEACKEKYKLNSKFSLLAVLTAFYLFSQLFNVMRWAGVNISGDVFVLAILGDFFPEFRAHSFAYDALASTDGNIDHFGILGWIRNFAVYFFPGPVYDLFGLNRVDEFNRIWVDFFKPVFWADKDADFGVRVGLVGEIALALGREYLVLFALLFAILAKRGRLQVIFGACIAGTIPYGATAIYILPYSIAVYYALVGASSLAKAR